MDKIQINLDMLPKLMETIKYQFKDINKLQNALIHKSFLHKWNSYKSDESNTRSLKEYSSNERLEFLGDAVLDLIISTILMKQYPLLNEGDLSKIRAAIVNEKSLAQIARNINLGDFLLLGKGEELSAGRNKSSILADALESLIGAIYSDSNLEQATSFVNLHFKKLLDSDPSVFFKVDYKTNLQELTQAAFAETPVYTITNVAGPDHNKTFTINVSLKGKAICEAEGKSKKEAAQTAAKQAIRMLEQLPLNHPDSKTKSVTI